jgi:hypothetical protein
VREYIECLVRRPPIYCGIKGNTAPDMVSIEFKVRISNFFREPEVGSHWEGERLFCQAVDVGKLFTKMFTIGYGDRRKPDML